MHNVRIMSSPPLPRLMPEPTSTPACITASILSPNVGLHCCATKSASPLCWYLRARCPVFHYCIETFKEFSCAMTFLSDLKLLTLNAIGQHNGMDILNSTDTLQSQDRPTHQPISNKDDDSRKISNSDHLKQDTASKVAALEQRYIDLLEKRISSLEAAAEDSVSTMILHRD